MKDMPDQATLTELLVYDPRTGDLLWRARGAHHFPDGARFNSVARKNMWNGRCAGQVAFGRTNANGYLVGCILGRNYTAHRIIWKMIHGLEPDTIDHINGVRTDNRIENLRAVDMAAQSKNKSRYKTNTSGFAGVTSAPYGMWKAQIGSEYLGLFRSPEEAAAARKEAEEKLGYHENHGRTNRG